MKRSLEDFVEYFFRFVLLASGVLTAILLLAAVARLVDTDAVSLSHQP
ncbi:hypothetical protein HPT29_015275 [Microvirga terrae]|uniref:Uncharacterized protein n=1 Tax=Microvirga terrae TaxID=2740529 RepID=A0ABY5RKY9_9HYPH|nr:hypothetical protein [Microvirga terrae]UVF17881.1 hypothetical protein HPT29_015275 [Microvirga terrae]